MRFLVFSIIYLFLLPNLWAQVSSQDEKKKPIPLEQRVLDLSGITDFKNQIEKLKKYKSLKEIDELEYELKYFFEYLRLWYFFDHINYHDGLKKKIQISFKKSELIELEKYLRNPFIVKVLKYQLMYRDLFSFYIDSISFEKQKNVNMKHTEELESIFNLNGYLIQEEALRAVIDELITKNVSLMYIIDKNGEKKLFVEQDKLKERLANLHLYILENLHLTLKNLNKFELKEYIRIVSSSKVLQRYNQLIINYHYLYFQKYIKKLQLDKAEELRILNIETKNAN